MCSHILLSVELPQCGVVVYLSGATPLKKTGSLPDAIHGPSSSVRGGSSTSLILHRSYADSDSCCQFWVPWSLIFEGGGMFYPIWGWAFPRNLVLVPWQVVSLCCKCRPLHKETCLMVKTRSCTGLWVGRYTLRRQFKRLVPCSRTVVVASSLGLWASTSDSMASFLHCLIPMYRFIYELPIDKSNKIISLQFKWLSINVLRYK